MLAQPETEMNVLDRFWKKVNKLGNKEPHMETRCWVWTASQRGHGYGGIGYKGRTVRAHRLSWILHNGDIPKGLCVLHACDNRLCVRPEHLWLGSHKDNAEDRDEKGRRTPPSGENHYTQINRREK